MSFKEKDLDLSFTDGREMVELEAAEAASEGRQFCIAWLRCDDGVLYMDLQM